MKVLKVVAIPEDVPAGHIVGRGGWQCKLFSATFRVRCRVDFNKHEVNLEGSRRGVEEAEKAIHRLFEEFREHRELRDALKEVPSVVHRIVIMKAGAESSTWRFERRAEEDITADSTTKGIEYCLVRSERIVGALSEGLEVSESWITSFGDMFLTQAARELDPIHSDTPIKVKAAFGAQCFAIPDVSLASGDSLTWDELQALRIPSQLRIRWSNAINRNSKALRSVINNLEAQLTESTRFRTELVVYLNRHGSGPRSDVTLKYRWENDEWMFIERDPTRVAFALYNIAVDADTAFRVRVYSRQSLQPPLDQQQLARGLTISLRSPLDPFSTEVESNGALAKEMYVRHHAVREHTTIEWQGLRVTLFYMDAARKTVTLACRLTDDRAPASLSDQVVALVRKLTEVTSD